MPPSSSAEAFAFFLCAEAPAAQAPLEPSVSSRASANAVFFIEPLLDSILRRCEYNRVAKIAQGAAVTKRSQPRAAQICYHFSSTGAARRRRTIFLAYMESQHGLHARRSGCASHA